MAFKLLRTQPELPKLQKVEEIKKAVVQEPEEPKQEAKELFQVVDKLPVQEIRSYKKDDGTIVNLITVEEALTEIFNARTE